MFSGGSSNGRLIGFLYGMCAGILLAILFLSNNCNNETGKPIQFIDFNEGYDYLRNITIQKKIETNNETSGDTDIILPVHEQLAKDIRILCWVLTQPNNHKVKAIHVKKTWGQRCTKLLFMSTERDDQLGAIDLNVTEGRPYLWGKTKAALKYIYNHHFDDADWFMKADDDTYVIMENLRYMVYPYSTQQPIFFGLKFTEPNMHLKEFATGGSGYVLSKEALRRFVEEALPNPEKCLRIATGGGEDVELSKCLLAVNVELGDSRDSKGRQRFFHLDPQIDLRNERIDPKFWYWQFKVDPRMLGPNCCSDIPVSFHYITPGQMYDLDYLIYKVRPYGIEHHTEPLPSKIFYQPPATMTITEPSEENETIQEPNKSNE